MANIHYLLHSRAQRLAATKTEFVTFKRKQLKSAYFVTFSWRAE